MNIGGKRIYNKTFEGKGDVVLWDVFPVIYGEKVLLTFESKNSEWSQGIWFMCDQSIEINDAFGKSAMVWFETAPQQVSIKCYSENGLLNIYNIWDRGNGPNSQSQSSGMLIEEFPNGRRYKCNDIGFKTDFDKLVFKIEHLT